MLSDIITFVRIIFLPLVIYLVAKQTPGGAFAAFLVMVLAIITDVIDNVISYYTSKSTAVRSFFDPFADKVLVSGILLTFAVMDMFTWWVIIAFILRDLIVGVLRFLFAKEETKAHGDVYGKIMISAQYLLIMSILLDHAQAPVPKLSLATSIFTIISLLVAVVGVVHLFILYIHILTSHQHKKKVFHDNLVILANKKSRGYKDGYRRRLLKLFCKRRGASLEFLPKRGDIYHDLKLNSSHVIIAGGDGTFESALNTSLFHDKALGFFPLGAGNAYYSYFYKGNRFEYLRERFGFEELTLDILEIEWEGKKRQTTFFGLGIDGDVIGYSSSHRTKHGFFDYVKGSYKTLIGSRSSYPIMLNVDGRTFQLTNCFNLMAAKIPYLGFGIRSFPKPIKPNDGQVYILAAVNKHHPIFNKILRFWALILPVLGFLRAPLVALKGQDVVIKSDIAFPFHAGGEYLGKTKELKVRVVRQQKVLVI